MNGTIIAFLAIVLLVVILIVCAIYNGSNERGG